MVTAPPSTARKPRISGAFVVLGTRSRGTYPSPSARVSTSTRQLSSRYFRRRQCRAPFGAVSTAIGRPPTAALRRRVGSAAGATACLAPLTCTAVAAPAAPPALLPSRRDTRRAHRQMPERDTQIAPTASLPSNATNHVVFHMPFTTGVRGRASRGAPACAGLVNSLRNCGPLRWREAAGPSLRLFNDDAGSDLRLASKLPGLEYVLPHRVVEWKWSALKDAVEEPSEADSEARPSAFERAARATTWQLIDMSLAFWESGGGLVAAAYRVEATEDMDWRGFASVVGDDDAGVCEEVRKSFEPLARKAATALQQVAGTPPRGVAPYEDLERDAPAGAAVEEDRRTILWSHPTVLVELSDSAGGDVLSQVASAI